MKNRKSILLVVLLIAVGFAAVSTTLYINGSTNINPNQNDFNVYYSDAYVNGTQDKSVITDDTHIVFETELSALGEKYVLDYEVTNGSKNYDAELVMECTGSNEYLTVTNEFDDETVLESQGTRKGELTLELTKSNAGEDVDVSITCTINANAVERTSLGISDRREITVSAIDSNDNDLNAKAYSILDEEKEDLLNSLSKSGLLTTEEVVAVVEVESDRFDEFAIATFNVSSIASPGDTIIILHFDEEKQEWEYISEEIVDANGEVKADFTSFSPVVFAIKKDDSLELVCSYESGFEWDYSYTGNEEKFIVPCNGVYKVELWGAQGGSNLTYVGGKGAYTSGEIEISQNLELFITVGEMGHLPTSQTNSRGAFNGGGGTIGSPDGPVYYNIGATGGGATDIRITSGSYSTYTRTNTLISDFNSLKSRIMVAAGGGGSSYGNIDGWEAHGIGGAGGSLTGNNGTSTWYPNNFSYGGSQTSGGVGFVHSTYHATPTIVNGGFAVGGGQGFAPWGGGGAGYYGGGSGGGWTGGGAGGSSYISGHSGCDAILESSTENNIQHSGQSIHYSGYRFYNTKMIAGNVAMPNYSGDDEIIGNAGDGHAKITFIRIN